MKRRDLVQKIEELGCVLIRHGGKHDWYQNPRTRMAQPVPRHCEIKEFLARSILQSFPEFNKTRQPTEGRQGCIRATLARRGLRFSLARNL